MDQSQLKHVWEMDKDSRLLRYIKWIYGAEVEDLNFCLMFWGVLFSPFAIIMFKVIAPVLTFVSKPLRRPARWLRDKFSHESEVEDYEDWIKREKEKREKRKNSRAYRALKAVEHFFTKHKQFFEYAWYAFLILWIGYLAGMLIFLAITETHKFFFAVGLVITILGLLLGLFVLVIQTGFGRRVWNSIKRFFAFMFHGAKSFKNATCPRIEVK